MRLVTHGFGILLLLCGMALHAQEVRDIVRVATFHGNFSQANFYRPLVNQTIVVNNRVLNQAGITFTLQVSTMKEAQSALAAGNVDLVFPSMCRSTDRRMLTSEPLYVVPLHLVSLREPLETLSQLQGKRLGVMELYFQNEEEQQLHPVENRIELHTYSATSLQIKALQEGRVDAILTSPKILTLIQFPTDAMDIHLSEKPIMTRKVCYTVVNSPRGEQLRIKINQAIAELAAVEGDPLAPIQKPSKN